MDVYAHRKGHVLKYTGKKKNIRYISDGPEKSEDIFIEPYESEESEDIFIEPYDSEDSDEIFVNDYDAEPEEKRSSSFRDFLKQFDPLKLIGFAALIMQFIVSVIFVIVIVKLDIFSLVWEIAIIAGLVIMLTVFFCLWVNRRKALRILSLVLSLLLSVCLAMGSFYVTLADDVLTNITGTSYSVKSYVVAVLADDPAENIKDAADYTFGTISLLEGEEYTQAMAKLNEKAGKQLKTEDQSTVEKLYNSLFEKKVGALIYENSYTSTLMELDEEYEHKVKIIEKIDIKKVAKTKKDTTKKAIDVTSDPFIIFISGNDQYGNEISTTGRSDVNILATVNFNTHQVLLTVIPRDYYVPFPGVTGDSRDKLTHAGIYGMDVQIETIENIFDINIDYFVKVNFTSLINIIDAMGGLDINNPYGFGATYEPYYYDEGPIHLTGTEALFYARERKSIEGGDFARGEHQQMIIEAMINQLVSVNTLGCYTALMDALLNCCVTDMTKDQITDLVKKQIDEGGSWEIFRNQAMGDDAFQPSFAAGGSFLSVVVPFRESIEYVSGTIKKVVNGEKITDIEEGKPTTNTFVTGLIDYDSSDTPTDEENEINIEEAVGYEEIVEEPYEEITEYVEEEQEEIPAEEDPETQAPEPEPETETEAPPETEAEVPEEPAAEEGGEEIPEE